MARKGPLTSLPSTNRHQLGMGAAVVAHPDFVALFQRSHQRIYQAFIGVDTVIKNPPCGVKIPPGILPTWAGKFKRHLGFLKPIIQCGTPHHELIFAPDSYKSWMNDYLRDQGNAASDQAKAQYATLLKQKAFTAAISQTYPPDKFLFKSAEMAHLDPNLQASPVKREACPTIEPPVATTPSPTCSLVTR